MKINYSVKLIQHLLIRRNYQGFTIIEILAVILVTGVFAAIFFPSLTSCGGNKAILSEAKTYVGSINRAQQAYFIANDGKFANSLPALEVGIQEQTKNYSYSTKSTKNAAFNYGIARKNHISNGWFDKKPILNFVGAVFVIHNAKGTEPQTLSILCINEKPESIINPPTFTNGTLQCGAGTKLVN